MIIFFYILHTLFDYNNSIIEITSNILSQNICAVIWSLNCKLNYFLRLHSLYESSIKAGICYQQ